MNKTLILTPNRTETCGMYQLAKDLSKEFDGDIMFKDSDFKNQFFKYDNVISLFYPMHKIARRIQQDSPYINWICYNQGIPPVTKIYFPNFFRRQAMRYINWRNNVTMQGADKYWDITKREQKPRWKNKLKYGIACFDGYRNYWFIQLINGLNKGEKEKLKYALYVGRKTDYKNFEWLARTMDSLQIPFVCPPKNCSDRLIHRYYSGATMFATASTWEGYGRPVMEAQALKIPVVCFDVGGHKTWVKNGIVVPNHKFEMFRNSLERMWESLKC